VIMSPTPNIGGTCPPCPIWIDAPPRDVFMLQAYIIATKTTTITDDSVGYNFTRACIHNMYLHSQQ